MHDSYKLLFLTLETKTEAINPYRISINEEDKERQGAKKRRATPTSSWKVRRSIGGTDWVQKLGLK